MPSGTVCESLYGKTWKTLKWWFNAKHACTILLHMNKYLMFYITKLINKYCLFIQLLIFCVTWITHVFGTLYVGMYFGHRC